MISTSPAKQLRMLSVLQIVTGIGISVFWLLYFTVGMAPAKPPPCYFAFENSFPLPDTILAIALIASGANILKEGTWGLSLSLISAGGLIFLGVLDFSFSAQNGLYSGQLTDALQSAFIPLWCVSMGMWIILVHFRDRSALAIGEF